MTTYQIGKLNYFLTPDSEQSG